MKKLLVCINNLEIGGIQKSLIELLKQINRRYDITLFCINPIGEYIRDVPEGVRLISANRCLFATELSLEESGRKGFICFFTKFICSAFSRIFGKRFPAYVVTSFLQKKIGVFDVAISFSQPLGDKNFSNLTNEFILYGCKADRKITFVHCDFRNYGGNTAYNRMLYSKFDCIAAVSDSVAKKFLSVNPSLEDRIYTVLNCYDYGVIEMLSNDNPIEYSEEISIITVARLSAEKGFLRCLPVFAKLKEKDFDVVWHIVGSGPLKERIEREMAFYHLQGGVVLHGKQVNPYRFMKNATILLVPSFHEAAPMVFNEAMALGLPVISTDTTSAKEFVEAHRIGWVCENNEMGIYSTLLDVIENKKYLETKKNMRKPANDMALEQLINVLEG